MKITLNNTDELKNDQLILDKIKERITFIKIIEKKELKNDYVFKINREIEDLALSLQLDENKIKFSALCAHCELLLDETIDFTVLESVENWEENIDLINEINWLNTLTLCKILELIKYDDENNLDKINPIILQNSYLCYDDSKINYALTTIERILPMKNLGAFLSRKKIQQKLSDLNKLDKIMDYAMEYEEYSYMPYMRIYKKIKAKNK